MIWIVKLITLYTLLNYTPQALKVKQTETNLTPKFPYQEVLNVIKKYEGYRDTVYMCPSNQLTIGYGHIILPTDNFPSRITSLQADSILLEDFMLRYNRIKTDNRQHKLVLTLLYFSVGEGKIRKTNFFKEIGTYSSEELYKKYLTFSHINGTKHKLLYKRRIEELNLIKLYEHSKSTL